MVHRAGAQSPWRDRIDGPIVAVVVVASAIFGALAHAHPTGSTVVDPLYTALFAAAVTAAGAIAGRGAIIWLAAVAAGFSRGYLIFPALAALVASVGSALMRRPSRALNAATAAVAVQVLLRLPRVGFQGGSALVAAAAVLPVLIHAVVCLPRWGRRLVGWGSFVIVFLIALFSVPVAVAGGLSYSDASHGTTAAEDALRSVSDGDASSGQAQLVVAQSDFSGVAQKMGSWWTLGGRLVPGVAQQRNTVLTASQVARDVTAAAGAEAGKIDYARLHYQTGGIDLSQVSSLKDPLDRDTGVLDHGVTELQAIRSGWVVPPLQARLNLLTAKVAGAQRSATLADQVVTASPSLFGGHGTRRYMVVLTDPAEARGLGGLIVSYGTVTASGGHLVMGPFQDISVLNTQIQAHGGTTLTQPSDFVARYGQVPARFAQDVAYTPDLPAATQVMAQLYARAGEGKLDGLLVLDPKAIASMLQFSGPVQAAGIGQLTTDNPARVLNIGQYTAYPLPSEQTERRAALTAALGDVFNRLTSGSLPGPMSLSKTLDPDVRGRRPAVLERPSPGPAAARQPRHDRGVPQPGRPRPLGSGHQQRRSQQDRRLSPAHHHRPGQVRPGQR